MAQATVLRITQISPTRIRTRRMCVRRSLQNKALYAAGHSIVGGRYVRHRSSSGCSGPINDGCLWVPFQFDFHGDGSEVGTGTSLSSQALASSLASVLAVFPNTSHQNLAKFAKACAKKSGQGIEALLRTAGGVGVADFSCMGDVTTALANLPSGGSATTTVNGVPVVVRGRDISLSFTNNGTRTSVPLSEVYGIAFQFISTGEGSAMLVATKQEGEFFTSLGAGTQQDFFGFTRAHGTVRATEVSAGHRNAFIRYSEQYSSGGDIISSAKGQSLGITLQKEFVLSEDTLLSAAMHSDQFLNGTANIPFGTVDLERGGWNHYLSLSTTTHLNEDETISFSTGTHLPDNGADDSFVGVQYGHVF